MPRLVPQILARISKTGLLQGVYSGPLVEGKNKKQRRVSLWKPSLRKPNFELKGRTHSLLLDEFNPLLTPQEFEFHKSLPPRIILDKNMVSKLDTKDQLREMTLEEKQLWSSPYCERPTARCTIFNTDHLLHSANAGISYSAM